MINNIEQPYENDADASHQITARELVQMLLKVPGDYEIKFDSAYGMIMKCDFTIYHEDKVVSLNG